MYELPAIGDGTSLRIDFEDPNPARPQGLRLEVRGGTLEIAGNDLTDVVLWSDSAPKSVRATVKATRGSVNLRLWNCWRDPAGSVQAWIGNAGILVSETTTGIVLRCSDGFDDVTFGDLVAAVQIDAPNE